MFSRDGALVGRYGRHGEGPGEFRELDGLFRLPGDTLIALDLWGPRFTMFAPGGEAVSVFRLPAYRFMRPVGVLDSVELVFNTRPPARRTRDGLLPLGPFHVDVADSTGHRHLRLGPYPGGMKYYVDMPGYHAGYDVPFSRHVLVAARGTQIAIARALDGLVTVFSADGTIMREFVVAGGREALTPAGIERYRASHGSESRWSQGLDRMLGEVSLPDTLPAVDSMLLDRDGGVWIRRLPAYLSEQQTWHIYRPDVRRVDSLRLDARIRLLDVAREAVAGLWWSELDEPTVSVYRIVLPDSL